MRIAGPGDVPALLDLIEALNRFEGTPWSRDTGAPALRTLLADESLGVAVLVEDGGAPLGYYVLTWGYDLEWKGRDAFLTDLYLVPEARGRGLGRQAMQHVLETARRHDACAIHLMVRPDNFAAAKLYASTGFASPPRVLLSKALDVA